jgi:hypothetical protein
VPHSYCKVCVRKHAAKQAAAVSEVRKRRREAARKVELEYPTKFCPGCEQKLPKESFYKQRDMRDGRRKFCIECYNLSARIEKFMERKATARTKGVRPGS